MSRTMVIINGEVFANGRFEKKDIRIENGMFMEIAEPGQMCGYDNGQGYVSETVSTGEEVLDATGRYIIPGLVDVHTHGRCGKDFSKITEEGLQKLLLSYAKCGVTSVIATTMTNEPSMVEKSLQVIGERIGRKKENEQVVFADDMETGDGSIPCANLLGIHMEGPFLGKKKKGAHDETYLQNPDWERFEKMQRLSDGSIRLVTVDPSLDGAEDFIKQCVENNLKVSLGHTACDYETAIKAQKLGADHVTHTFNAMNPLHHRAPGLIGAAMDTGMYMELICDGIHVHPALIRLLFAAHPDQVVLISDSIPAAGMPDGEYESGGKRVKVTGGKAVLNDGTIAGSVISLFDSMVNAIKFGVTVEKAVNSATYLPAKSAGMEDVVGSIAVGRKAEFLVVDKNWRLEKVYM